MIASYFEDSFPRDAPTNEQGRAYVAADVRGGGGWNCGGVGMMI